MYPYQQKAKQIYSIPDCDPESSEIGAAEALLFLDPAGGLGRGDMGLRTSLVGLEGTLE